MKVRDVMIEEWKKSEMKNVAVPFQTGSNQPLSNSEVKAIVTTAREDGKFSHYTQQYVVEPGQVYVLEVLSNDDLSIARDLDKIWTRGCCQNSSWCEKN